MSMIIGDDPAPLPASARRRLGPYYLTERIGQDGMATLFRAARTGPNGFEKSLVVRAMLPTLALQPELVERFTAQARITAQLSHPGIAQVYDFGVEDGVPFVVREDLDGVNLAQLMGAVAATGRRLPVGVAAIIATEVCEALGYAHRWRDRHGVARHLVCGDVSPDKVIVCRDGGIKLADLGATVAVDERVVEAPLRGRGQLAYAAPEQVNRLPFDRRADVFAVGVMLHEMLTGRCLFAAPSDLDTLRRIDGADVMPPSTVNIEVPRSLDAVVMTALARDLARRFEDAAQMATALQDIGHLGSGRRRVAELLVDVLPEPLRLHCDACSKPLVPVLMCMHCDAESEPAEAALPPAREPSLSPPPREPSLSPPPREPSLSPPPREPSLSPPPPPVPSPAPTSPPWAAVSPSSAAEDVVTLPRPSAPPPPPPPRPRTAAPGTTPHAWSVRVRRVLVGVAVVAVSLGAGAKLGELQRWLARRGATAATSPSSAPVAPPVAIAPASPAAATPPSAPPATTAQPAAVAPSKKDAVAVAPSKTDAVAVAPPKADAVAVAPSKTDAVAVAAPTGDAVAAPKADAVAAPKAGAVAVAPPNADAVAVAAPTGDAVAAPKADAVAAPKADAVAADHAARAPAPRASERPRPARAHAATRAPRGLVASDRDLAARGASHVTTDPSPADPRLLDPFAEHN